MFIHVIYESSGRIISANLEEFERKPGDPVMKPAAMEGQFAATYKIADSLAPRSLKDFVAGARIARGASGPKLIFEQDPGGTASAMVMSTESAPMTGPPAGTALDVQQSPDKRVYHPFAVPLLPLDAIIARVAGSKPALADVLQGLRDLALAAAVQVYDKAVPDLTNTVAHAFELSPATARRLEMDLLSALPSIPPGKLTPPSSLANWKDFSFLSESSDLIGDFWSGVLEAFDEAEAGSDEPTDDGEDDGEDDEDEDDDDDGHDEDIDDDEYQWYKVATLERQSLIPTFDRTEVSGGYPLYCETPGDWDEKDEPKGAEMPYLGRLHGDSLKAPNDSVTAGHDVTKGWKANLSDDLPKEYFVEIPLGYKTNFYHWMLSSPGLIDSDWFNKELARAEKTLRDKQKDIEEKVQQAAEGAVKGTIAAPLAPVAGVLAKELAAYITDYLIDILSEHRYQPVVLAHLTIRPKEDSEPKSLVMLASGGSSLDLNVNKGDETNPKFEPGGDKPEQDLKYRHWTGASIVPDPAPRIKQAVARAGVVVVWRKAFRREGFGAFIPQRESRGGYVCMIRADVRLLPVWDPDVPEPV